MKGHGGKAYGVYNPDRPDEFAQNDRLQHTDRIDHYGRADYRDSSETSLWLRLQIQGICDRIVADREVAVAQRVVRPPRHLNPSPEELEALRQAQLPKQATFL